MGNLKVSPPQLLPRRTVQEYRDFMRNNISPLYELSAAELGMLLDLADPNPRPWLRAEEVKEEGYYWMRYEGFQDEVVRIVRDVVDGWVCLQVGDDSPALMSSAQTGSRFKFIEPELPEES